MSYMFAAQCPNLSCDYPLQLPWSEDIKINKFTNDLKKFNTNDILTDGLAPLSLNNDAVVNLKCPGCNENIGEKFIKQFKDVMEYTDMHLQNMKDKSITCILYIPHFHV